MLESGYLFAVPQQEVPSEWQARRAYRWAWPEASPERAERGAEIERSLQIPPALALALAGRPVALRAATDLSDYTLVDSTESIGEPDAIEDAARLLVKEARQGRIGILCDYDVDGATAQAILVEALRAVAPSRAEDPPLAVPHRNKEGFGPNERCLDSLRDQGVTCIAVLDCGTASGPLLDRCHESSGIVPVVVDHHPPHQATPPASGVLVNPWVWRKSDPGEQGSLCAAALTWFLARAMLRAAGLSASETVNLRKRITLLAAMGTACDQMRLDKPFNRALVRTGVRMANDPNAVPPGYAALRETIGAQRPPDLYEWGWKIGPRLNAGSRMGESDLAARCLRERDPAKASELASTLDQLNVKRRELGSEANQELDDPATMGRLSTGPVNVHTSDSATPGTIGLVAAELVKRFGWPAFGLARREDGLLVGSGRSALRFDVGAAVDAARDQRILLAGGGHAAACGLKLAPERVEDLRDFMAERFAKHAEGSPEPLEPAHPIDVELKGEFLSDASLLAVADSQRNLEPWGQKLEPPLFGVRECTLAEHRVLNGDHLMLKLASGEQRFTAVWWRPPTNGKRDVVLEADSGRSFDLLARVELNEWRELRSGRLVVVDVRPSKGTGD